MVQHETTFMLVEIKKREPRPLESENNGIIAATRRKSSKSRRFRNMEELSLLSNIFSAQNSVQLQLLQLQMNNNSPVNIKTERKYTTCLGLAFSFEVGWSITTSCSH